MKFLIVLSLLWSSQTLSSDSQLEEFFVAVNRDNVEKVSQLIQSGVDVNATLEARGTRFSAIMLVRGVEVAQLLINAGANLDLTDKKNKMNALHWIIYRTCDARVVEVLLKDGNADPNTTAPFHPDFGPDTPVIPVTPVDMAVMTGCDDRGGDVIGMLLKYGGDGKFFRELLEKNTR